MKLKEIQQRVDRHNLRVAEIAGEKKGLLRRLSEEHGCSTIKEAATECAKLTRQIRTATTKLENLQTQFEETYADQLEID